MHVLLPKIEEDGSVIGWKPMNDEEHMLNQFKKGNMNKMTYLINKVPTWNNAVNSYMLNFHGRVTVTSIKNFQLININNSQF